MKTVPTEQSVEDFLEAVPMEARRRDGREILEIMQRITGERPVMWGPSIVGFGRYHYKYESGREGDFMLTGFSPRKTALTVYVMPGFGAFGDLMERLGKYKTGRSCLYLKRLGDVDRAVLEEIIRRSVAFMREKYPDSSKGV